MLQIHEGNRGSILDWLHANHIILIEGYGKLRETNFSFKPS